jgi:hypothetical protein
VYQVEGFRRDRQQSLLPSFFAHPIPNTKGAKMSNKLFDEAYDFAELNKKSNSFCKKMMLFFKVNGYWTKNQIDALLRIKDEQRSKWSY